MAEGKSGYSKSITKKEQDASYKSGFAEGAIIQTRNLREMLIERKQILEDEFKSHGNYALHNRILELCDVITLVEKELYKLSPGDCDWRRDK